MTREETLAIMGVLKTAYPAFYRDMTRDGALQAVSLWTEMFAGDDAQTVSAAVKALIKTRKEGYPPTIGEVSEKIRELTQGDGLTRIQAWNLVAKACKNGIYGAEEEFAKLPPIVQKTVGSPNQLREWAMMDAETFSVTGSHFQRSFETMQKREQELSLLPPDVRERLAGMTAGLLTGGRNE
jgi:hypothetical protein